VVLTYPVHVMASERQADAEDAPEWVTRLKAAEAERQRLAYQAYINPRWRRSHRSSSASS